MKKLLLFSLLSFNLFSQTPGAGVTDIDGNQYATVIIGTQEWMAENLNTTKYNDGTTIPLVTDATQWSANLTNSTTLPMMCWYNNDQATYTANNFGALYNWYAVSPTTNGNRNVCPTGWHVPTDAEWSTFINYLDPNADGGNIINTAGGKMKSTGTQYWLSPNTDATNESGFSGLPSGFSSNTQLYIGIGSDGCWWSTSELTFSLAHGYALYLGYNTGSATIPGAYKDDGHSIRCLKGAVAGIETIELPQKKLLKITDILGRDTEFVPNTVQIYHYSDGTVEKVLTIE